VTFGPVQCDPLYCILGTNRDKQEENMKNWRLLKGPLTAMNRLLDEILQFAVFAHQVVPWL
jgi:hypothetical protein